MKCQKQEGIQGGLTARICLGFAAVRSLATKYSHYWIHCLKEACVTAYLQCTINVWLCLEEPKEYLWSGKENQEYFGNCWLPSE